jgi:aryl-alcohol dehydrogenase-like predicted oxidoreductase
VAPLDAQPSGLKAPSFTHRSVRALGAPVHRLGIACNFGLDERGFDRAVERGVNYVYWTSMRTGGVKPALRRALAKNRERLFVGTGPTVAWFGGNVRRAAEGFLKDLGTDYLDVFHLFWVGRGALWTEGVVEALVRLREEGKAKAIGISIHDRKRAAELAEDSPLDLFMLRYNAAHPGAERDVFPHLATRQPAVVAYTATSWRKLMKRPSGWTGPIMSAGDCYRFCLTSPHVDIVLSGARSEKEVDENLDALERGPLDAEEEGWMRAFGAAVHG